MRAKLDSFFHDIGYRLKIANDTKKLLDKQLASSFSLFPYIAPNENLISRIIRDLLDPQGNHGQGDIFLRKFFEIIEKPDLYEIGDIANVRIEERTTKIENDKRRIDILIDIRRNNVLHAGIAIENKPWEKSVDQQQQVDDYLAHIKKCYSTYYIVYLTPEGKEPSDHSAKETKTNHNDKLIAISYKSSIATWLKACHKESQAEYVRQFLLDFSNYCQHNLDTNLMTDDQTEIQTIFNYISESDVKNRIETAAIISKRFIEVKQRIIASFSEKLLLAMRNEFKGYTINSSLIENFPNKYGLLKLSKEKWLFSIGLENEAENGNNFGIGLPLKTGKTTEHGDIAISNIIFPEIEKNYSSEGKAGGWLYFLHCDKFRYWTQPETLAVLHENPQEAINYFVGEFRKILAIVEPLIEQHPKILTTCQPAG